jgi:hypothetical protein
MNTENFKWSKFVQEYIYKKMPPVLHLVFTYWPRACIYSECRSFLSNKNTRDRADKYFVCVRHLTVQRNRTYLETNLNCSHSVLRTWKYCDVELTATSLSCWKHVVAENDVKAFVVNVTRKLWDYTWAVSPVLGSVHGKTKPYWHL